MGALEIFLIVFGVLIVIVSFIFGEHFSAMDKNEGYDANVVGVTKELVEKEVQAEIANVIDEKIEKAEIELDKITNKKIMALGEYSDDINSKITRNHDEVMFLYDMLSDKEKTVKNTIKDVEALKLSVKQMAIANDFAKQSAKKSIQKSDDEEKAVNRISDDRTKNDNNFDEADGALLDNSLNETKVSDEVQNTDVALKNESEASNNNKAILNLYNQGKSNIEIAKELGLGMGEVKLVIDLFNFGKK